MVAEEALIQSLHTANAASLHQDLAWFEQVLQTRLALYLGREAEAESIYALTPPQLDPGASMYAGFLDHYEMDFEERFVVLLALVPHVYPHLLDVLYRPHPERNRGYTEFGGIQGKAHGGFLPTAETALFVLSEGDLQKRFEVQQLFDRNHFFARHNLLKLEPAPSGEPIFCGQIVLAEEMIDFLTTGELRKPDFSRDFPARLLQAEMTWEDLVLAPSTLEQLTELKAWIAYGDVLMDDWGLKRRLRPGYRCLFYGPPGTGKTITATLLGKHVGKDVYRIDLSSVVSKYIGETEKNLERIFVRSQNMNCILFFDEGDAIFGKRTNVSDAHDRYANQEVAYLLQRIEDYPGLVILATNFKSNLDDAFMRRFQAVVHFPMPNGDERRRLWKHSFSTQSVMDDTVEIDEIAEKYELAGGSIMNVVRYASLMALIKESNVITRRDLISGIRRELQKDGKTL